MQYIGKIIGIHGLKGEVNFSHQLKKNPSFKGWDCMLVELNPNSFIPFFIEHIRITSEDEGICKFEEIENREMAKQLSNKNIYTSPNYSVSVKEQSDLQQFVGYIVFDHEQLIGPIVEALSSKMNNMFLVKYLDKEILIPAQEDLILAIDPKKKIISMDLPIGLLDL